MFDCPEHALAVAFAITALPIEPKNATQLIVEALRERHGLEMRRLPSGLTPHEWHAQAVMVLQFAKRSLAPRPDLWRAIVAEYSPLVDGALAIQGVTDAFEPGISPAERGLADLLVMRQFRGKPSMRTLATSFGVSSQTVLRRERLWRERIGPLRASAIECLAVPMKEAGLIFSAQA